jgi:dTDP-4-amino-4,6-dideoxygalactose transaminase
MAYSGQAYPVSKHAAETVLALPMFADLSEEDVDRICKIILN